MSGLPETDRVLHLQGKPYHKSMYPTVTWSGACFLFHSSLNDSGKWDSCC